MKFAFAAALCAGLLVSAPVAAVAAPPLYRITHTIALSAPDHWDYLYFDASAKRLYISHGDEVTVVDGSNGKIVGQIADLPGSHGIAVAGARGIADSAKNKTVTLFDTATLKSLGTAPAGDDADGITYDASSGRAFVADGDAEAVTAIDMATGRLAGTLSLGGKPEFLVSDGAGHVFINSESTREILRVDARDLRITARFPIPDCEKPHGIAIDPATRRVFTSCVNAKLFVVDAETGKVVASLPIGKGSDAVRFDPKRKLVFSSNGEGTLSVIAEKNASQFRSLANVPTIRGARTMDVDSETGRVFLVTADLDHVAPPDEPGGHPHMIFKPGTLKLYFLDPVR